MDYMKLEGKPFNDEFMTYVPKEHKYKLNINWIKKKIGQKAFRKMTDPEIKIFVDESKDNFYLYLESESRRENYDVIEYRIAKKDYRGEYNARLDVRDGMLAFIKYGLRSGGDMLGDHHAVNTKKGTFIVDWVNVRKELEVSSSAVRKLKRGRNPLIMVKNLKYGIDPLDYRSDY